MAGLSPSQTAILRRLRLIWLKRGMLLQTALTEARRRYAGSVLGSAWMFLGPFLLLSVYTVVYMVVFRFKPPEMSQVQYVLYILSGLVAYLFFSEGLTAGTTSLSSNRELLLNTIFPAELVPVRAVLIAAVPFLFGVGIIMVVSLLTGSLGFAALLVPVVGIVLFLFLVGVAWILSLVNLVLRDVQQVIAYVTIILLIASPIAYTRSMVPPVLAPFIYLNPLSYFVVSLQYLIVLDQLPPLHIVLIGLAMSFGVLVFGFLVFDRAKQALVDYA